MKSLSKKIISALVIGLFAAGSVIAADEFVLRPKYPQVKPISTAELTKIYDQAIIVDARAEIEYDVVHIAKAVNIPVSQGTFIRDLEKVRAKNGAAPLVFYCNGTTCAKSYKASKEAMDAGFTHVLCYDAGIKIWVDNCPEKSTLMGHTPAVKEKLISDEAFTAKKVSYAEFARMADQPNTMVIDIREPFQRARDPKLPQNKMLTIPNVRNIPSDRLVELLKAGQFKGQQLLLTDAVGKQVEWVQYYLEEYGYGNYHFLKRGVLAAAEAGAVK